MRSLALAIAVSWLFTDCAPVCPYSSAARDCPLVVAKSAELGPNDFVPSFYYDAPPQKPSWPAELVQDVPPRLVEVACNPLDCEGYRLGAKLVPYSEWRENNRLAFEELRRGTAVYPLVIVPGYERTDAAGVRTMVFRLQKAVRLLQHGWVSAILVSGGHWRGGFNEAAWMAKALSVIGRQLGVDLDRRVIIEPCAAHTSTNLRNGLQMLEAMGLRSALLVTDGDGLPAQSARFDYMDGLAHTELHCPVGTVSRLRGPASTRRAGLLYSTSVALPKANRASLYGRGRASVFLVRPYVQFPDGSDQHALQCDQSEDAEPVSDHCEVSPLGVEKMDLREELAGFEAEYDCPEDATRVAHRYGVDASMPEWQKAKIADCKEQWDDDPWPPDYEDDLDPVDERHTGSFALVGVNTAGHFHDSLGVSYGVNADYYRRAPAYLRAFSLSTGYFAGLRASMIPTSNPDVQRATLSPEVGIWALPLYADVVIPFIRAGYALDWSVHSFGRDRSSALSHEVPLRVGVWSWRMSVLVGPTLHFRQNIESKEWERVWSIDLELGYRFRKMIGVPGTSRRNEPK